MGACLSSIRGKGKAVGEAGMLLPRMQSRIIPLVAACVCLGSLMIFSQQTFLETVALGRSVLFDGSAATALYERGVFINRSFDEAAVSNPELLIAIHREFLAAGANVITTNTWGANFFKLRGYGLESQLAFINTSSAQIACRATDSNAWVAGTIGPLGVRIEPWGPTSLDEAREHFRTQVQALANGGVQLFMLEAFADLNEIQQAILAVRDVGDFPIVAMMTTNDEGQSLYGTEPEWFVQKLAEWGANIVGVNGGGGPAPLLELAKRLTVATSAPLILKPNAGSPRLVDGRLIYMASPEYLGEFARQALLAGVRVVGGCSGTTAAHTRAMAAALRQNQAFQVQNRVFAEPVSVQDSKQAPVGSASQSRWAQKLQKGVFVQSIELLPPRGLDSSKLIERARTCKEKGIDAINIPDGPRASARMSALASACLIEREVGIETVLHYACRDRNLLGMQSDLIGAAGLGLKNVLCITGDPPKMGPYPNATAVFDIDSIGLVNMMSRLNTGYDLGGSPIGQSPCFSCGVGANPVAPELDREFARFRYKVEAGAQWAMTQPVFDPDALFRFLDFAAQFRIPIIAGVWPFTSLRNAEFMANEVPGVYVPESILERMRRCKSSEDQQKEGLAIAHELVSKIRSSVQGLQISAPLGNIGFALQLIT
jgi:methionine synthase I (cobalamin-dependent)/5,10-methylenetetrahydrofolate reductase